MMTLTNEIAVSQSEETSLKGKEVKLCVNHQELQVPVKSLLQVVKVLCKKRIFSYDSTCVFCLYMQRCCATDPPSSRAVCGQKWSQVSLHDWTTNWTPAHPTAPRTPNLQLLAWRRTSPPSRNIRSLQQERMENLLKKNPNVSDLKVIGLNWHCVWFVTIYGENLYSLNVNLKKKSSHHR